MASWHSRTLAGRGDTPVAPRPANAREFIVLWTLTILASLLAWGGITLVFGWLA